MKKKILFAAILSIIIILVYHQTKKINFNNHHYIGETLDSLNGVKVFFNGGVNNVTERNLANGYNLGLKYQCVEFVKRYYYKVYNHKMPDTYGHAKSFFEKNLNDGQTNTRRNLLQYSNPSASKPQIGDLIVMSGSIFNRYGHVCIVSKVENNFIEIIQQNSGPFGKTREKFELIQEKNSWLINNKRIKGWLRK